MGSVVKAIRDLKAGIVTLKELPPSLQHDEMVLEAAIRTRELSKDALVSLRPEDYKSPAVLRAVGDCAYSALLMDDTATFWTGLFSLPEAREEVFPRILARVIKEHDFYAIGLLDVVNRYTPPELTSDLKERIVESLRRDYLASDGSDERRSIIPPMILHSDRDVVDHYIKLSCKTGSVIPFNTLLGFGLPESEALTVYRQLKSNPATDLNQLIYVSPVSLLLGEWKSDYIGALKRGQRPAIGRLDSVLIADQDIAAAVTETIEANPALVNALRKGGIDGSRGLGAEHPFALKLYQRLLSRDETLRKIVETITADFPTIRNFPDSILAHPLVHAGVKQSVNQALFERGGSSLLSLIGGKHASARHFPADLESKYIAMFPELLSLLTSDNRPIREELFLYNPGALTRLIQQYEGRTPPEAYTRTLLTAQQAGQLLEIFEFGRFDNAYEIFRNRYQVESPETQARLKALLGEDYFKDIVSTNRKLCVIVNPSSSHDHNGAFLSQGIKLHNPDIIDSLMTAHHVLYFEGSDEVELIQSISAACATLGRKIDLLILGGHGHTEGISLGVGRRIFDATSGHLGVEDEHVLSSLAPSITVGGTIVLESCSTAGGEAGSENIASVVHRAIPHAHVFGPKSDTAVDIRLREDGTFEKLEYHFAQRVHINPSGDVETESLLASRVSDARVIAYATARNTYNDPVGYLKLALISFGAISLIPSISRAGASLFRRLARVRDRDRGSRDEPQSPSDADSERETSPVSEYRQLMLFDLEGSDNNGREHHARVIADSTNQHHAD